jgi:hypothetical protein
MSRISVSAAAQIRSTGGGDAPRSRSWLIIVGRVAMLPPKRFVAMALV